MLVTLIPLFLAATIGVNETDWKYGAEVIYDVKVGTMTRSDVAPNTISNLNWKTKLMCREKSRLVLSCHIFPLGELNQSPKGPCELHFASNGLKTIVCSSSLEPAIVDTVKAVADQLNLGADLSTIPRDIFDVTENSTTGECKTGYVLSSKDVDDSNSSSSSSSSSSSEESNEQDEDDYEIVIVPGNQTLDDEVKTIERKRRLNECRRQYRLIFAIMQRVSPYSAATGADSPLNGYSTQFNSSESRMTIKENSFDSRTEKTFITNNTANPSPVTCSELVEVNLDKIVAATGPLPSIKDPLFTSIYPERWMRSGDSV